MIIVDSSDKAMVERFGDVLHEIPELWDALRMFEMQNRPVEGGLKVGGDAGISMKRTAASGSAFRIHVGNPKPRE